MPHLADQHLKDALAVTLIQCRQAQGISQEQLAEDTGLSRVYISLLERQQRIPKLDTLLRLCAGLNLDPLIFMSQFLEHQSNFQSRRTIYPIAHGRGLLAADSGQKGVVKKS